MGRDDLYNEVVRALTQSREMLWKPSKNLGKNVDIFTGMLPNCYGTFRDLCFDSECSDDPMIDNPQSDEYNLELKLAKFLVYTEYTAFQYKTKNLIMVKVLLRFDFLMKFFLDHPF